MTMWVKITDGEGIGSAWERTPRPINQRNKRINNSKQKENGDRQMKPNISQGLSQSNISLTVSEVNYRLKLAKLSKKEYPQWELYEDQ